MGELTRGVNEAFVLQDAILIFKVDDNGMQAIFGHEIAA